MTGTATIGKAAGRSCAYSPALDQRRLLHDVSDLSLRHKA